MAGGRLRLIHSFSPQEEFFTNFHKVNHEVGNRSSMDSGKCNSVSRECIFAEFKNHPRKVAGPNGWSRMKSYHIRCIIYVLSFLYDLLWFIEIGGLRNVYSTINTSIKKCSLRDLATPLVAYLKMTSHLVSYLRNYINVFLKIMPHIKVVFLWPYARPGKNLYTTGWESPSMTDESWTVDKYVLCVF